MLVGATINLFKADLSITRIAGLTWNEWNARLAMPLVKQLSEGVQSLVFPTDLTINSLEKQAADNNEAATQSARTPTPPTIKIEKVHGGSGSGSGGGGGSKTPSSSTTTILGSAAANTCKKLGSETSSSSEDLNDKTQKLNQICEEEATALIMKQEKGKCGNLSDTSYSEDNNVSAAAAVAQVAADFNLCNMNILSSISAMNSLIGATGNGSLSLSAGNQANLSGSGASGGNGHPCPECGRVYKLKSSLRNHQKWECGKEPQFQCPFCVYRAKQKMHIGRHMERMHKEKFIKLEDLKSYTSSTSAGSGVGNAGGGGGGSSVSFTEDTASLTEMRQHYSN